MTRGAAFVLVLVALLAPEAARAHGDPASDVLDTGLVFYPFGTTFDSSLQSQLNELAANARAAGVPIKVALIEKRADLGVETALWRKPQRYARSLGADLAFLYKGRLLIVMPNGFGFWHGGRPVAKELPLLRTIPVRQGPDGLAESAVVAVRRLAAQAGRPLPLPKAKSSSETRDRLLIVGAALALLVVALAVRVRRRPLAR